MGIGNRPGGVSVEDRGEQGVNKKSCPFGTAFNLIGFNFSNSEI